MKAIQECQKLDVKNLITFRGKVKQEKLSEVMLHMKNYVKEQGANVVGGPISVTYAVEQTENGTVADAEIMMPLDKIVPETEEYVWKDRLFLTNAVKLRYEGAPTMFQGACNEMNSYIQEKKYTPITAGYIVTKGIDNLLGMVDMEVYVGVSPNLL